MWINQINQSSVCRTAHPPLKIKIVLVYLVVSNENGFQFCTLIQTFRNLTESIHAQDNFSQVFQIRNVGWKIWESVTTEIQKLQQFSKTNKWRNRSYLVVGDVDFEQKLDKFVKVQWKLYELVSAKIHSLYFSFKCILNSFDSNFWNIFVGEVKALKDRTRK